MDQTFRTHVFEGCARRNNKGDLRKLSGEKKSSRMRESVLKSADVDICEKRETLDVTVLICRVIGHLHIALTDCLALDTDKVDGLFLGVFTDDLHNM